MNFSAGIEKDPLTGKFRIPNGPLADTSNLVNLNDDKNINNYENYNMNSSNSPKTKKNSKMAWRQNNENAEVVTNLNSLFPKPKPFGRLSPLGLILTPRNLLPSGGPIAFVEKHTFFQKRKANNNINKNKNGNKRLKINTAKERRRKSRRNTKRSRKNLNSRVSSQ
jgi:hypothetical protein